MITLDREELERILAYFHLVTGFRVAVFDSEYHEVAACPQELCSFCTELRKNPKADTLCKACDRKFLEKSKSTGKLQLYLCDFGLYEATIPLYDHHQIVGYMMVGQMISNKSGSKEIILWKSKPYWNSDKSREALLDRIPTIDYKNIKASAALMSVCATYLSLNRQVFENSPPKHRKLLDFIRENYRNNFTDKELCDKFGISRTAYFNTVKKAFGKSKTEYIYSLRIEDAKAFLASTDKLIGDIAREVGFDDPNYFSRIFHKFTGMSPGEFRNLQRKD
jgi:AraC-like DNA-binding protein/ligand-binding sensor protein